MGAVKQHDAIFISTARNALRHERTEQHDNGSVMLFSQSLYIEFSSV